MTNDEFRAYLSIEMEEGWSEDRLYEMLSASVRVRGGSMGGSIRPEPVHELEFYESLRDDFADRIRHFLASNDDIPYMGTDELKFHSNILAQDLVDSLTKDALL